MSGVVTLLVDSQPVSVLCHMGDFGCGDGGWTPILKIDGTKVQVFLICEADVDFIKIIIIIIIAIILTLLAKAGVSFSALLWFFEKILTDEFFF